MGRVVLDTSVVLALLLTERGGELLTDEFLSACTVSSVNLAEVQSVLVRRGAQPEKAWEEAYGAIPFVEPFTTAQARLTGTLIHQTRSFGLSLGDRACLALAFSLDAPVYTADRAWKTLKIGCRIHVIR